MLKEYLVYGLIGIITGIFHFGSINREEDRIVSFLNLAKNILIGFLIGICILGVFNFHKIYAVNLGIFFAFLIGFERLFIRATGRLYDEGEINMTNTGKNSKASLCQGIGNNYFFKIFIGTVFVFLIFLLFYLPFFLEIELESFAVTGIIWGAIGGLIGSSVRGAWKYYPKNGFDWIRFFRSPLVAGLYGGLFSLIISSPSVLLISCIGAERMTIDLYKRFFKKSSNEYLMNEGKKFKGKAIITEVFKWIVFIGLLSVGTIF
jgi:hypothetical protein